MRVRLLHEMRRRVCVARRDVEVDIFAGGNFMVSLRRCQYCLSAARGDTGVSTEVLGMCLVQEGTWVCFYF